MDEKKLPWLETPLDHWTADIDPSIMAGDDWVNEGDPGNRQAVTEEAVQGPQTNMVAERFMHPQHDVEATDD